MVFKTSPVIICFMRAFKHPALQDLTLERVLYALSDPVRLEIIRYLADVPDYGTVREVMFGEAELDDDQKRAVLVRTWNAAAGVLERAHLVDSARGGTNDPANLVPLCVVCHREMTDHCFTESKEAAARFIEELPDYSTRALSGAPR